MLLCEASFSRKSFDWQSVELAHDHRELAVPADRWVKVIYSMQD
jgi:hypothetical protein